MDFEYGLGVIILIILFGGLAILAAYASTDS